LERAERLFAWVTNGLDLTSIEFGENIPSVEISLENAQIAAANALAVRAPKDKPYLVAAEKGVLEIGVDVVAVEVLSRNRPAAIDGGCADRSFDGIA
jgi:hypothetical protein